MERIKFISVTCPKCGTKCTAFTTIVSSETGNRRVVFDACCKCGTKTTDLVEEDIVEQ